MRPPALVRRRSVPVPTLFGGALLLALLGVAAALLFRSLGDFLAPDDRLGRGLLVVEGWLPQESLRDAADVWREGRYDGVVTTGGPIEDPLCDDGFASYADRAAAGLRRLGVPEDALAVAAAPASAQDRTYRNAVSLREWIEATGRPVSAIDLVSRGPHARRSRALYQRALGDGIRVGVIALPPRDYDLERWWRRSDGAKDVLAEGIGWAFSACCFHPGPRGSHEELWAVPDPRHP